MGQKSTLANDIFHDMKCRGLGVTGRGRFVFLWEGKDGYKDTCPIMQMDNLQPIYFLGHLLTRN